MGDNSKETTQRDKRIVTCDFETAQYEDETIKCEKKRVKEPPIVTKEPSVYLSPPSFLLQRGWAKPISFLASRIPLLDHSINRCEIGSFLTAS